MDRGISIDSKKYIIDSGKGDEYQLNSSSATTSFMDILNHNVVFQTQKRIYGNGDAQAIPDADNPTSSNPHGIGLVKYYED